jgi:hypothetical protein
MPLRRLWQLLRYTRWLLSLTFLGLSLEFVIHRQQHFDAFGHLSLADEVWMFGLPLAAVFVGCLELMIREKAGIARGTAQKAVAVN